MELLLKIGDVGMGDKDNSFYIGQVLNQMKIFSEEVVVCVTEVLHALH